MAWKITVGEQSMLLDDLSQDDLVDACKDHPELNWLRMYLAPASDPNAFYDLVAKVARRLGEPIPDRPQNVKQAVAFLDHLTQVDDDLPVEFGEGGIPLETAVDQETITSSTSTAPESGIPTKPVARH